MSEYNSNNHSSNSNNSNNDKNNDGQRPSVVPVAIQPPSPPLSPPAAAKNNPEEIQILDSPKVDTTSGPQPSSVLVQKDSIDVHIPIEFRTLSMQLSEEYQTSVNRSRGSLTGGSSARHRSYKKHSKSGSKSGYSDDEEEEDYDEDDNSLNSKRGRRGGFYKAISTWMSWKYWVSWFFMFGKSREDPRKIRASIQDEFARLDHHRVDPKELFERYGSDPTVGLSQSQVAENMSRDGLNQLSPTPSHLLSRTLYYIFGGLGALVWFGVIVAWIAWKPLGDPPDPINMALAIVLLLVIAIQTAFNMWQEWTTSKVMNSLNDILPTECIVVRDNGQEQSILASNLVVGDIVKLKTGSQVPADLRLVGDVSRDLSFDRSALTGEAEVIYGTVNATSTNYLETRNIALMGTFVANGSATGIVVSTGDRVVMRRIAEVSMARGEEKTLLQREINRFVAMLAALALSLAAMSIIVWAAWLRPTYPGFLSPSAAMVNIIAILVGVLPNGVPICVALTLSMMAKRMQSQMVLVKSLNTVEALGSVNVICCDKTGTITKSDMYVQNIAAIDKIYNSQEAADEFSRGSNIMIQLLHQTVALCNNASFDAAPSGDGVPVSERKIIGDATDSALLRFAEELSPVNGVTRQYKKMYEIPFNSRNKWMMAIFTKDDQSQAQSDDNGQQATTGSNSPLMVVKGGSDVLLSRCKDIIDSSGNIVHLDENVVSKLREIETNWSTDGQRVLMVCRKQLDPKVFNSSLIEDPARIEALSNYNNNDLTIVGLVSITVPPRPEIPEVVEKCNGAGIRLMMVTGDHMLTAVAIARQCRIITHSDVEVLEDVYSRANREGDKDSNELSPDTVGARMLALQGRKARRIDSQQTVKAHNSDGNLETSLSPENSHQQSPPSYTVSPPYYHNDSDLADVERSSVKEEKQISNLPPHIILASLVLTGSNIASLANVHWDIICRYQEVVFCRTTPEQKLCIVNELRERDYIVAALGDGINDAPALKAAHVGVAMGGGSEAAKEAAGMILLDNNFSSLLVGIENGRLAFDNLKKVILYLIPAGSFSELLPILINIFLGVPLPLSAFFMIVICVLTDVACSVTLISEKPESDILKRPPRDAKKDRLVNFKFIAHCYFFLGMIEFICAHAMYFFYMYHYHGIPMSKLLLAFDKWTDGFMGYTKDQLDDFWYTGQSIYFVTLVVCQFGNLLATRTRRVSIFHQNPLFGPSKNLRLFIGIAVSLGIAVIIVYVPFINNIFHTRPVPAMFWFIPLGFAFGILILDELRKLAVRTKPNSIIAKAAW
ncbi:hypothetical protein H4219_004080 [Mycoemilia scoparia]|uniref:Cation-transporting P-type ATPase N-terminal domain-containing protein n=1 Tax=Mycoemilia scoparia TaxID=417184 RepID=A0A9W7ZTC3_9FUNG|nr:hypothetical protein H4219_004080 [Mycoemilia scoparia]